MTVSADVIVCEDVRQEVSGKMIVAGIFLQDIQVTEIPSHLVLSFWLRIFSSEEGSFKNKFFAKLNGREVFSVDGVLVSDGSSVENAFLQGIPLNLKEEGILSFVLHFEDGRIVDAGKIPFKQRALQET